MDFCPNSFIERGEEAENVVLLVEDQADMMAITRFQLSDSYCIIEAIDGKEGIEKAISHIPDLIISDVMMPGVDGFELCQVLKQHERTSHIPIILLTAKADLTSRLAGLERGADAYLSKPFHRDELRLRVQKLIELREQLRRRYLALSFSETAAGEPIQHNDIFLHSVRNVVLDHLTDKDFDMELLARYLGMSRSQVFRKVKALTGQPPSRFIRSLRLTRGRELLETTTLNVSEVAYEVGFSTPNYFSDAFYEAFGIRPSEIRNGTAD